MRVIVEVRMHPTEALSVAPHQLADAVNAAIPAMLHPFMIQDAQGWNGDDRTFVRYQVTLPTPYDWKE